MAAGHVVAVVLSGIIGFVLTASHMQGYDEGMAFLMPMFYVTVGGFIQILWVLPFCIWAGMRGRRGMLIGALGSAGLIFLVNAGCWGLMAGSGF